MISLQLKNIILDLLFYKKEKRTKYSSKFIIIIIMFSSCRVNIIIFSPINLKKREIFQTNFPQKKKSVSS